MQNQTCQTVKTALTDLRAILIKSKASGVSTVETGTLIARLESTISEIEEKALSRDDISVDSGRPIIMGLTSLAI